MMNSKMIVMLVVVFFTTVLSGCRRGEEAAQPEIPQEVQLEQEVNQFLEENNVQLPEGSERVNLADPTNSGAKGVVTTQEEGASEEVTVLAALPEPTEGSYYAWIKRGDNDFQLIGQLMQGKGGYMLEKMISGQVEGQIVVSREIEVQQAPSTIVLEGLGE